MQLMGDSEDTCQMIYQIYSLIIVFRIQFVNLIPISYSRPRAYQLQRSATEHSTTCKSHFNKQQASYLSVTEERY
jgi:hypothetical protein